MTIFSQVSFKNLLIFEFVFNNSIGNSSSTLLLFKILYSRFFTNNFHKKIVKIVKTKIKNKLTEVAFLEIDLSSKYSFTSIAFSISEMELTVISIMAFA